MVGIIYPLVRIWLTYLPKSGGGINPLTPHPHPPHLAPSALILAAALYGVDKKVTNCMYLTYLSYITVDKIFGLKAGNKINKEKTRLFCKKK